MVLNINLNNMDNYKQLYEKANEEYKEFYPLTDILSIIDKESGKNLKQLLNQYNHIKLDWKGNTVDTRNSVPLILRHKGLFITYDNGTSIITEFYKGEDISVSINSIWQNDNNWTDLSPGASLADNEDIAEIDGKFKFADRGYSPAQFTGMGRAILRKNLVDVGGGTVKNVLTQNMINKSNTIYEIRYDFDLNGQEITIPEGCVLDFQGGSISNGNIIGNELIVQNAYNVFNEINITGTFKSDIPLQAFGYLNNPKYNFSILYKAFQTARQTGVNVNFDGVTKIDIELTEEDIDRGPIDFDYIDFKGIEFNIINNVGNLNLFKHINYNEFVNIEIDKSIIDTHDYSSIPELSNGDFILEVDDTVDWVTRNDPNDERTYRRKDIILIHNGYSENLPIYNYKGDQVVIKCRYIKINPKTKGISNATFIFSNSTYTNMFCLVDDDNNIQFNNVNIKVYNDNNLNNGVLFTIRSCTNILFENCNFYGQYDNSGYAYIVNTTGVYNILFSNVKCLTDKWHFNGANYTSKMTVLNSTITGLDSHLYNKDYTVRDSIVIKHPINSSGVYGQVVIENCEINEVEISSGGSSYNIFNKHDLIIKNCVLKSSSSVFNIFQISSEVNSREEIAVKYLPNIYIDGITVIGDSLVLINLPNTSIPTFYGIKTIQIKDIKFISNADSRAFQLTNRNLHIDSEFNILIDNVDVINIPDENLTTPSNDWRNAFIYRNIKPVKVISMIVNNSRFGVNEQLTSNISYTFNNCTIEHPYPDSAIEGVSRTFNNCKFIVNRSSGLPVNAEFNNCLFDKRISDLINFPYAGYNTFNNCRKVSANAYLSIFSGIETSDELNLHIYAYGSNNISGWRNKIDALRSRPSLPSRVGGQHFDTNLNKMIWWTGTAWVDATGAEV